MGVMDYIDDRYHDDYPNPHGCMSCKHFKETGFREYKCTNPNGYWYDEVISKAADACNYWEED